MSYQYIGAQWQDPPSGTPPTNNADAPINVGTSNQIKLGDFTAVNVKAGSQMWSPEYCDENGANCFTASTTGSGSGTSTTSLPTCSDGELLMYSAASSGWVCSPSSGIDAPGSTILGVVMSTAPQATYAVGDTIDAAHLCPGQHHANIGWSNNLTTTVPASDCSAISGTWIAQGEVGRSSGSYYQATIFVKAGGGSGIGTSTASLPTCGNDELLVYDEGTSDWVCTPAAGIGLPRQADYPDMLECEEPDGSIHRLHLFMIGERQSFGVDAVEYYDYHTGRQDRHLFFDMSSPRVLKDNSWGNVTGPCADTSKTLDDHIAEGRAYWFASSGGSGGGALPVCANGETLIYNTSTSDWECATAGLSGASCAATNPFANCVFGVSAADHLEVRVSSSGDMGFAQCNDGSWDVIQDCSAGAP